MPLGGQARHVDHLGGVDGLPGDGDVGGDGHADKKGAEAGALKALEDLHGGGPQWGMGAEGEGLSRWKSAVHALSDHHYPPSAAQGGTIFIGLRKATGAEHELASRHA